ncbi:hypothetical protein L873DRAFT_1810957 [Choiromyces venosus 120613-1]|uniref:Amidoligase enzyme n=1 Tax=Choiromyces venosus 120613-1 TaxID=1336337 RepID=A0A3N4JEA9_9PEZI|nr:hypothetical protein L873DRAFT_1810957 [Choiromyces venosus 120613-1]
MEPELNSHGISIKMTDSDSTSLPDTSLSYRKIYQAANALQTDNTASIMTIGMELEFLLPKSNIPTLGPTYIFDKIRRNLQTLFHSGGISNQTEIHRQNAGDQPDRRKFQLMEEKSCDLFYPDPVTGKTVWCEAIELCTPILRFGSWKWVIPTVVEHLTSEFDCQFNNTTGLHVHVGRGCGWELADAKAIASAVIIFESTLDHYHPPHRRPYVNWCIQSNRYSNGFKSLSKSAIIKELYEAENLDELIKLISPTKFFKYNFNSLKKYGTIEFRQADAAISMDQAVEWINRVISFVTAAVETDPEEFKCWAKDEDPADCCPPENFDRFGVPWVGSRAQVVDFLKEDEFAFGRTNESAAAVQRQRRAAGWGLSITDKVQESLELWIGEPEVEGDRGPLGGNP